MLFDFEIEVFFPKHSFVVSNSFTDFGFLFSSRDHLWNLSIHRSREHNNSIAKFLYKFKINSWTTIIVSFELGSSYEFDKVPVSRIVFRKKNDLIYFIIFITIGSSFFRKKKLNTDNRFHSLLYTRLIKLKRSIHISSIRYGNCFLSEFFCSFNEFFRGSQGFLKCIMCMCVKVNKRHKEKGSGGLL